MSGRRTSTHSMDAASSPCGLTYDDASGLVGRMTVLDRLGDSDPAIRWQVLRDLVHAPAEVVAAERARVATQGWGARLLALQGEDGQWAGGACFPARSFNQSDENQGQPWTATLPTLQLLRDLGVDPCSGRVRRAVALVRDHCRWEHAGQPFFSGEVEPCINGRTVTLGTYFDQDVDGVVARLIARSLGPAQCFVGSGRRRTQAVQSATRRRGTRRNSSRSVVTSVAPRQSAWAAIMRSRGPIGVPSASRVALKGP